MPSAVALCCCCCCDRPCDMRSKACFANGEPDPFVSPLWDTMKPPLSIVVEEATNAEQEATSGEQE